MIYHLTIDAFALTPATAEALKQVRDDRQLAKSRMTVLAGGLAAAVAHYGTAPTPQVIIVEEDEDDATLLARLEQLAEVCEPSTKVLVIGGLNDIKLYRTLLAQGVGEYLLAPIAGRQVLDWLAALFSDPTAKPKGKVIACWGARGGTGSSTLAQNLAWSLARQEATVYVDLDIAFGTSVLAFNMEAKQTVVDALAHPERLDEVLMERCMVDYDEHLQLLASPGDCRKAAGVTVEGIDRMLDLAGRMAGAVVLDLPHQWSAWTEHVLTAADEVVVTANPDLASLRDCKTLVEALAQARGPGGQPRLVLNRMDAAKRTQLGVKDFEDTVGLTPVLVIPFEPQVFGEAANNGQMIGESAKTSKLAEQFHQLAALLGTKTATARKAPAKRKGLLDWLKK